MAKEKWLRGNIHPHTSESDGDSDAKSVVSWYRKHNYDFLVLTDHNHLTILNYEKGRRKFKKPLMIPGEEVTAKIQEGSVPIHINGIGISRVVEPIDAEGIIPTIQANVDAIIEAGGIASINHPNYKWALTKTDLSQVVGASLLEIHGPAVCNDAGAPGYQSAEQIWDSVLSTGRVIFGVAVDDAHHYHDFDLKKLNPGRGWVMVRTKYINAEAIIDSLASGNFYSSTGVYLKELETSPSIISLTIEQQYLEYYSTDSRKPIYITSFYGRKGQLLKEVVGIQASYKPSGNEQYVRATVNSSSGFKAWTQPVFIK